MALAPGIELERAFTVTRELTAAALAERVDPGGVTLPEVWSTPDMIGKMENAFDEKEKVGEGTHVRFVLDAATFAARLREKAVA